MIRNSVKKYPTSVAMGVKRDGRMVTWNYEEYYEAIRSTAKGFLAAGLERQKAVGIMGHNSPEWFMSSIGSIFAGGLSCGIYTTNSAETVAYMSGHAPFNVMVLQDADTLARVMGDKKSIKEAFPTVKKIVLMDMETGYSRPSEDVISWRELIEAGKSVPDSALDAIEEEQFVNDACMLVYTSGTTGPPKGAMYCHDNITYSSHVSMMTYGWGQETLLSYLPLSHVAACVIDGYMILSVGGATYCADKDALKGTLVENLKEVRPTKFLGVPRVWEKMQEKMQEVGRKNTGVKKALADWAKAKATEHNRAIRTKGLSHRPSLGYKIARKLVLRYVASLT